MYITCCPYNLFLFPCTSSMSRIHGGEALPRKQKRHTMKRRLILSLFLTASFAALHAQRYLSHQQTGNSVSVKNEAGTIVLVPYNDYIIKVFLMQPKIQPKDKSCKLSPIFLLGRTLSFETLLVMLPSPSSSNVKS